MKKDKKKVKPVAEKVNNTTIFTKCSATKKNTEHS
jgi:hypothetical protein